LREAAERVEDQLTHLEVLAEEDLENLTLQVQMALITQAEEEEELVTIQEQDSALVEMVDQES
jgi:hypothetical protein